jgi:hypothetical protein
MRQTAPTIQKQPIQKYKVYFSIKLAAFQASGSAELQLIAFLRALENSALRRV